MAKGWCGPAQGVIPVAFFVSAITGVLGQPSPAGTYSVQLQLEWQHQGQPWKILLTLADRTPSSHAFREVSPEELSLGEPPFSCHGGARQHCRAVRLGSGHLQGLVWFCCDRAFESPFCDWSARSDLSHLNPFVVCGVMVCGRVRPASSCGWVLRLRPEVRRSDSRWSPATPPRRCDQSSALGSRDG